MYSKSSISNIFSIKINDISLINIDNKELNRN